MIRSIHFFSVFMLVVTIPALSQHNYEGVVTEAMTDKPIIAATVELLEEGKATTTNRNGFFQFKGLPEGSYTIRIRHTGYFEHEQRIRISSEELQAESFHLYVKQIEFDEIIVSANPVQEPVKYQPSQALNAEELQRKGAGSFGEILDGEPGIHMRYFGPAPSRPGVRGFGGERMLVLQNSERPGDVSQTAADHAVALETLQANRIEVVRGPASLLYGSNALGGVVNIFTNDIPRNWGEGISGNVSLQAISNNKQGAGMGTITFGEENWAFSGRFSHRESGDTRTPAGRLPDTAIDQLNGGGGFGYRSGNFNGGISFNYTDHDYGIPKKLDDPDVREEIRSERFNLQGLGNWRTRGFVENIEWRLSASQYELGEWEIENEDDGVDEDLELLFEQYTLSSTVTFRHRPFAIFDEGAFGVNTHIRQLDIGGEDAFIPDSESQFIALFLFEEVPLSEILRLQFGARGEFQRLQARSNPEFPDANQTLNDFIFSGSVGLNYQPRGFLEAGIQYARSQRAPGFEELFAGGPHRALGTFDIGNPGLNNEIGNGVDAFGSFKSDFLLLEISAFYNRINNFIIRRPTGEIDPGSELPVIEHEADNAEMYGGEVVLRFGLTERLRFDGSLDYVRGTRLDNNTPLPFIPPLSSKLSLRYDTGLWWVGGNIRLVSEQTRTAENELPTDGYELVNLEAGYRFDYGGRHVLSLRIDNLFDVTHRNHLSRIEDRNFPMPGMNANLTYRWTF